MVKILFFGDLVETLGMASDEIKLPPDVTADAAAQRFLESDDVLAVQPATNFAVAQANDDGLVADNFDIVRVRDAWDTSLALTGDVGSHALRIAVDHVGGVRLEGGVVVCRRRLTSR